jgi:uncharacterized membrane protein YfcA
MCSPPLFFSAAATHISAAALLLLAVASAFLHLKHRRLREQLLLAQEPGTIASAVTIGAGTDLATLLSRPTEDMNSELKDMRFGFDVATGKIVTENRPAQAV